MKKIYFILALVIFTAICGVFVRNSLVEKGVIIQKLHFDNQNGYYTVNEVEERPNLLSATLKWQQTQEQNLNDPSLIIQDLQITVKVDNYNELQVKITDIYDTRFTLPYKLPFPFTKVTQDPSKDNLFEYSISKPGEIFKFILKRKDTGEILFDTNNSPLIFQDKYLEITNNLDNGAIFGLGERRTTYKLSSGQYSIWAADASRVDYGQPGQQIYGTHPMYLKRNANTHNFHVVFLRNAYGMMIDYTENSKLTYKVIGGNFDFKFFIGEKDPEIPIKLYHNYINGWILHPFWVQDQNQKNPNDDEVLFRESQFMLGDFLMAAPVVAQGNNSTNTTNHQVYIPQTGVFYDFYTQQRYTQGLYNFVIPFDSLVPLYVRAGKIVHIQDQQTVLRSRFLDNHFTLYIALDDNMLASGTILTINDYNNDANIVENCIGESNCVVEIVAKGKIINNSKLNLNISVNQLFSHTQFQEVYINKFIIAGIEQNGEYVSKILNLSDENKFSLNKKNSSYNYNLSI